MSDLLCREDQLLPTTLYLNVFNTPQFLHVLDCTCVCVVVSGHGAAQLYEHTNIHTRHKEMKREGLAKMLMTFILVSASSLKS